MAQEKLQPVDGDYGYWEADDVQVRPFNDRITFIKVHLYDPASDAQGYYTARLIKGQIEPDPTGDQPDPFNPNKVYVEPGSDTWDKMLAYIRHKIMF